MTKQDEGLGKAEKEGLAHLREIEKDLDQIKELSVTPKRAFVNGIFQGGGAVVGGILAVLLIGWLLAISGIIPGLDRIAPYLQEASEKRGW